MALNVLKELLQAVDDKNEDAVRVLLGSGVEPSILYSVVNAYTTDGNNAFIYSLYHYLKGERTITKLLLPYSNYRSILLSDDQIDTLEFIDFIRLLIEHRADFLTANENNKLQLVELLLATNNLSMIWNFIDAGLDIKDAITTQGENIYHLLAKYCQDGEADYSCLILHNIDLYHENNDQNSPLMIASFLHNLSFIQYCIGESCHGLDLQNRNGHTALHLCIIGFAAIVKRLREIKSDEHLKMLCDFNYYENFKRCVVILLKVKINVNSKDNSGKTALMRAVMTKDKILVETLLKAGADPWLYDNHGRYAVQYFNFVDYSEDLTCFKLLFDFEGQCKYKIINSLNFPQINGHSIIQNMVTFQLMWPLDQIVLFIKFLIGLNISLHTLNSSKYESCITLKEFSSAKRKELREIFYLSGAPSSEIIRALNFDVEERAMQVSNEEKAIQVSNEEKAMQVSNDVGPRQAFARFCSDFSLEKLCRRVIRQSFGPNIQEVAAQIGVPHLYDFLLLNDCPEYGIPRDLDDDRFTHNQITNNNGEDADHNDHDNINYDLYDLDSQTDCYPRIYDHIQYLNEESFYSFD